MSNRQAAGAVPDVEGNLGSHMIASVYFKASNRYHKEMTLQLENATSSFLVIYTTVEITSAVLEIEFSFGQW